VRVSNYGFYQRLLATLLGICISSTAFSATLGCGIFDADGSVRNAIEIEAVKDSPPTIRSAFDIENLANSEAVILDYFSTGMADSDSLGVSYFFIQEKEGNGQLLAPSFVAVDWRRGTLAKAYVPFLSLISGEGELLAIESDFRCQRLD